MGSLGNHFNYDDVVRSATAKRLGIDNSLPEEYTDNVQAQADLLEDIRASISLNFSRDVPMAVTSWFRCERLNHEVGGQPTSYHLIGLATDFVPMGVSIDAVYEFLAGSAAIMQKVDQLILEQDKEGNRWIHVGQRVAPELNRNSAFRLQKHDSNRRNAS